MTSVAVRRAVPPGASLRSARATHGWRTPHPHPAVSKHGLLQMLVYLGWGILLFRPDWWFESLGIGGLARVPLLCTGAVALVLVFKPSQRDLHWPLLYFLVFTGGTLPFSYNIAYTRDVLNQMVVYSVLAIGAISLLRSVHDAKPLIVMVCLAQFGWFQLCEAD